MPDRLGRRAYPSQPKGRPASPRAGRRRRERASSSSRSWRRELGLRRLAGAGSWTIRSTSQRSDSGRRSKLRSSARSPGRRTARSMSRKPAASLRRCRSPTRARTAGEVKPGSTPRKLEHAAASSPRGRRFSSSRVTISIRSGAEGLEVGLELEGVAAAGRRRRSRVGERLGQRAVLVAAPDVVEVVGEHAVDRVADHVDEAGSASSERIRSATPVEAGPVGVVGRALAAHAAPAVEVARVPVRARAAS